MTDQTHNAASEAAIAALILDGRHSAWNKIAEIVKTPLAFFDRIPQAVAIAACELTADGVAIDAGTIAEWLSRRTWADYRDHCRALEDGPKPYRGKTDAEHQDSALAQLGGFTALAAAGNNHPSPSTLKRHAQTVAEFYRQRRAIEIFNRTRDALVLPGGAHKSADLIGKAVEALAKVQSDENASTSLAQGIASALSRHDELQAGRSAIRAASWGLPILDERAPLDPGSLWTLAARSGTGKTSLLLHAIEATAKTHGPGSVAMVSREMGVRELAEIIIARHLRVPRSLVRYGRLGRPQREQAEDIRVEIEKWSPEIQDGNTCTSADACTWARARQVITGGRLALLCVDHVGILSREHPKQTDYDKVSEAMHKLKSLARTLDIAVLVLCQMNRDADDPKRRKQDRPTLRDLKGSGAVGEDSDGVLFLYRSQETLAHGTGVVAETAKNRGGPLTSTSLVFHAAEGQRFADQQASVLDTPNPIPRSERLANAAGQEDIF